MMKKFKVTYTSRSSTLKQGRIYSEYELRRYLGKSSSDAWNGKAYCWNNTFCTQIEEVKKMEFKKSDLVAGKHVVEYNDGGKRLVLLKGLSSKKGHMQTMHPYDEDMFYMNRTHDALTIKRVYELLSSDTFEHLLKPSNLKLVWERQDNSKEIAKLEQDILELQEIHKRQIAKLEEQLEQLR